MGKRIILSLICIFALFVGCEREEGKVNEIGKKNVKEKKRVSIKEIKPELKKLALAVDFYHYENKRLPKSLEELLEKKGKGPYLKNLLKDPWGRDFVYRMPGKNGKSYEIICLGKDGKEGGSGIDKDISNWDLSEKEKKARSEYDRRLREKLERAKQLRAKFILRIITTAIRCYLADLGKIPDSLEDLVKGSTHGQYLKELPKDPWGNDFVYRKPGKNKKLYDVISPGRDGKEGGSGFDKDITNWEAEGK